MSADAQTTAQMINQQGSGMQSAGDEAIVVDKLTKSYGSQRVVDQLQFSVHRGEVFALLGPNGAGKTTTVETLEGYRTADEGAIRVLGMDPRRDAKELKPQIGVMLQQDGLYPGLTVREVLRLFAGYYEHAQDIDQLLERVGLTASAKTRCRRLSGGQKRRLALALALVGNPTLVFLDEPTAGMDPQARLVTWEIIRDLKRNGATVLLTTHMMDEAERLADRVAIIDHGRLIALDTPAGLTGVQNATVVRFVAPAGLDCVQLGALPSARKAEEIRPGSYLIETDAAPALLAELTAWLRDRDITLSVPVLLLIFFASLNIVPATNGHAINFLLPGMLALAVMATGMVSLGIATAYERYYGVLKRLGGSPLPRSGLIIAKVISVLALELIQTVILVGVAAVFYGWRPAGTPLLALPVMVLGTVTFAALGLAMAGALRAEVTLAGANGLYLLFLLLGGGILPLEHLPGPLAAVAQLLPAAALTEALRAAMTDGAAFPGFALLVLAAWAVVILLVAIRTFQWE